MDYEKRIEKLRNPFVRGNEGCGVSMIDLLEKINEVIDVLNGEPELRESEDERIRKELITAIDEGRVFDIDKEVADRWIAWLEKQKERAAVPDELVKCYKELYEKGGREMACIINAINFVNQQKEQKSVENTPIYMDAAKKYFDSWIEKHRDAPTKWGCFCEGILYSRKFQKPAEQPAEWTDADEKILKRIIKRLRFVIPVPGNGLVGVTLKHSEDTEAINWLKRRVTSQPQPKQEWSEEDKQMLLTIVNAFRNGTVSTIGQEQWLKSLPERFNLQPKQEWTEEDEKFYKTALWHIGYSVSNGKSAYEPCDTTDWLKGVKERLKALRPQPQWKPSEEQMAALYTAAREAPIIKENGNYLYDLYEQLKKL